MSNIDLADQDGTEISELVRTDFITNNLLATTRSLEFRRYSPDEIVFNNTIILMLRPNLQLRGGGNPSDGEEECDEGELVDGDGNFVEDDDPSLDEDEMAHESMLLEERRRQEKEALQRLH